MHPKRPRCSNWAVAIAKIGRMIMAAAITACAVAAAAQTYPARPVSMVVPFAPGGAGDILARLLGQKLQQSWGEPLVVKNRPGAGGVVAAVTVANADPDGYTLMIAPSSTMAINVSLYKTLPYDPTVDFVPLAVAGQTPFVLVVNPDLPVRSIADLIAYAKAMNGKLSYATAGPGVPHHLFAELLKGMLGIEMSPVAYRGSLPALNDVVAGQIPLMFVDIAPSLGIIRAGKVRPLGVSTKQRFPGLPDVPPLNDVGVPGFDAASWQMIVAPAKTPKPIAEKLHRDLVGLLDMPEIKEQILEHGMILFENPSMDGLQAFERAEIVRWSRIVQQAGLTGTEQ